MSAFILHPIPVDQLMPEFVIERGTLTIADGPAYLVRVHVGRMRDRTSRWGGWIEFVPVDGGAPIQSTCETTQPNQDCVMYWAAGLRAIYLEGALLRALGRTRAQRQIADPMFSRSDRRFLKDIGIAFE